MSQVYISTEPHQLPIIYREEYNVHFGGVEKLHPFDAAKWGHIFQVGVFFLVIIMRMKLFVESFIKNVSSWFITQMRENQLFFYREIGLLDLFCSKVWENKNWVFVYLVAVLLMLITDQLEQALVTHLLLHVNLSWSQQSLEMY